MTEADIQNQVILALQDVTGRKNLVEIHPETKLVSDLNLESIDFVDLIFECEQRLGFQIDLNDLVQTTAAATVGFKRFQEITLQDIVSYIYNHQTSAI